MNILLKIELNDASFLYWSKDTIIYDGNEYTGNILKISKIKEKLGLNNSLQINTINVTLDTIMTDVRAVINGNKWQGATVDIMEEDGTQIKKTFVNKFELTEDTAKLILKDNYTDLKTSVGTLITKAEFPNAYQETYGNYIPFVYGRLRSEDNDGLLTAWRVDRDTANGERYIINMVDVDTLYNVLTPDGTNITASCTIVMADSTSGYTGKCYIDYSATTEDYLLVDFGVTSLSNIDYPTTQINNIVPNSATEYFENIYDKAIYQKFYTYLTSENYQNVLQNWCYSFGALGYYFNKDRELKIKNLDYLNIESTKHYEESQILKFSNIKIDTDKTINSYDTGWDYDRKTELIDFPVDRDNVFLKGIDIKNVELLRNVYNSVKRNCILNFKEKITFKFTVDIDDYKNEDVGELIKVTHSKALTSDIRYYYIDAIDKDYDNNKIDFTIIDINHLLNLDIEQKILFNSNDVEGSQNMFNSAIGGFLTWENFGVYHQTVVKKYGTSAMRFDGSSYLKSDSLVHSDIKKELDFCDTSVTADFNLEMWVRVDNLGSEEVLYSQYLNSTNYIELKKSIGNKFIFRVIIGGAVVLSIKANTIITVNNWYNINIARVGSNWGLYVNGVQERYQLNANSYQLNTSANIGRNGSGVNYFTGYMDGFQISHNNKYSLSPNVGLTDSFSLSTKQQGFNEI